MLPDHHSGPDLSPALNWSTAGRRHPFEFWRDGVAKAFTELTASPLDERPFSGRIRLQRLAGEAAFAEIRSTAQTVHRTTADIRNRSCDAVFINFQVQGNCTITQRGIEARMPNGSLVLLDARQPFGMRFGDQFRQFCLQVPVGELDAHHIAIDAALARVIGPSSPFARPLTIAARDAALHPADSGRLASFLNLLRPALGNARQACLADQHLALIQHYVRQQLGQTDLSPATVSAHFRISIRHLHKLFARSGQSFGRFVLSSRLALSDQLLSQRPQLSLGSVAAAVGFTSLSHFSRRFREHFGVPASARRQHYRHRYPDR